MGGGVLLVTMKVTWKGDLAKESVRRGAARGLERWAEDVLEQAKRIVPIEIHTLQDSGNTDIDREKLEATVYFDTPYAARQHEELDWQHDEPGQAKYLETPLILREKVGLRMLAEEIRKEL